MREKLSSNIKCNVSNTLEYYGDKQDIFDEASNLRIRNLSNRNIKWAFKNFSVQIYMTLILFDIN